MKFILPTLILASSAFISRAQAAPEPTKLPDLVVTSVGVTESEDQIGTDAHLIARIENIGDVATKKDVAHGVAFYVDNEFVAWSDTYRQDLKPGQFAIVRSNSGPNGSATWKITPGKHTIRAVVDDAVRIDESNEENNSFETTLEWKTPIAMNSDQRPEFRDVSPPVFERLKRLQNAGLFEAAHAPVRLALPVSRYEGAVAVARLQDAFPDLKGDDKTRRLKVIENANAKLSPVDVEAANDDLSALQTEFAGELERIYGRVTGIEVRNIRPMTVPPPLRLPAKSSANN